MTNISWLEEQERITRLVGQPIKSLSDADQKYFIEDVFSSPEKVHFFVQVAKSEDGLVWVFNHKLIDPLFNPEITNFQDTPQFLMLSNWASSFVALSSEKLFHCLQQRKSKLNPIFWFDISRRVNAEQHLIAKWVPILLTNFPRGYSADMLCYILEKCSTLETRPSAIMLFDFLTRPIAELRDYSIFCDTEDKIYNSIEVEYLGEKYWLEKAWGDIIEPNIDYFSEHLFIVLINHLKQTFDIFDSWDKNYGAHNINRPAIREHEQNRDYSDDVLNFIIDGARDSLCNLIESKPELAKAQILSCLESDRPILNRLGLHGLAYLKPDQIAPFMKIQYIADKKWFYQINLRPEVFHLLEVVSPLLSDTEKDELIDLAYAQHPKDDEKDYLLFNLFVWLNKFSPYHRLANAIQEFKNQEGFVEREHPDLGSYISAVTTVPPAEPFIEPEALLKTKIDDALLQSIKEAESDNSDWLITGKEKVGTALRQAAKNNPEWGLQLLQALIDKNKADATYQLSENTIDSILDAFEKVDLNENAWAILLCILRDNEELYNSRTICHTVTSILEDNRSLPVSLIDLAFETGCQMAIWLELYYDAVTDVSHKRDYLNQAINHPAGKLAVFWFHILDMSIADKNMKYTGGLPERIKAIFNSILESESTASTMGRTIIGWNSCYLNRIDVTWFSETLVPMFSWERAKEKANQIWQGFLYTRQSIATVYPKLKPYYEETFSYLDELPDDIIGNFTNHFVSNIAYYDEPKEEKLRLLKEFVAYANDYSKGRLLWSLAHIFEQTEADRLKQIWTEWLRQFWQDRLNNIPVPLSSIEAVGLLELILVLEPVLQDIVELLYQNPFPTLEFKNIRLFYGFTERKLIDKYPYEIARVLLYTLKNTNASGIGYESHYAARLFDLLIKSKPYLAGYSQILLEICNEMARLRFYNTLELKNRITAESSEPVE